MTPPPSPDAKSNPIINSPYKEPEEHWPLDSEFRVDNTNQPRVGRRKSGTDLPVPKPYKQTSSDRRAARNFEPHLQIELLRSCLKSWRSRGYPGTSRYTRELLQHWSNEDIDTRPLWCQREAVETIIWLKEAQGIDDKQSWNHVHQQLTQVNEKFNDGIERLAVKMATGTGKTWVMAMLILWYAVNRPENETADVLIITPNLTVRDRLKVLSTEKGGDGETSIGNVELSLYEKLLPPGVTLPAGLHVTVRNYHVFWPRREIIGVGDSEEKAAKLEKQLLKHGPKDRLSPDLDETVEQMLDRVLPNHRNRGKLLILNDEAHHCYRMSGRRNHEGRWFTALKTIKQLGRLELVIDLSATPTYLALPVGLDYELFPWVVSDTPLIEAIEAGLTKIPQLPVDDDTHQEVPFYRNTYKSLNGQKLEAGKFPPELTRLLERIHEDYLKFEEVYASVRKIPVLIVVTGTIDDAEACYRELAGEKLVDSWCKGKFSTFSNVREDGEGPHEFPHTFIIHSKLDSVEEAVDKEVERSAKFQEAFFPRLEKEPNADYIKRLRHVRDTVGQAGQLGEVVRCIISVGMLTEGWDAKTVTHIVGYRAFESDLLCEQITGRALRRTSIPVEGEPVVPEYARVTGVPFRFMRGTNNPKKPFDRETYSVETMPQRKEFRIAFPKVSGYELVLPGREVVLCKAKASAPYDPGVANNPSGTLIKGVVGEEWKMKTTTTSRYQSIVYELARLAMYSFLVDQKEKILDKSVRQRALFASVLAATRKWLELKDFSETEKAKLLVSPHDVAIPLQIALCCVNKEGMEPKIHPVFLSDRPKSSDTGRIKFDTSLGNRYPLDTNAVTNTSELNRAACHSATEAHLSKILDENPRVAAWVRNYRLGWTIPYRDLKTGVQRQYEPDFVVRVNGESKVPRMLILEVKGVVDDDSEHKAKTVQQWWLPAVNGSDEPVCEGNWEYHIISANDNLENKLNLILNCVN